MYNAAKEIGGSVMELDTSYGCEVPIRSVHIDGMVASQISGLGISEKRQFSIVFEYDYVTISETMIVADVHLPVSEFVKRTSFDSVEQAKKFIEAVINWVKSHDTCDAFIIRNCPDMKWTMPDDIEQSAKNLHHAAAAFNDLVIIGGRRLFIYGKYIDINYSGGIVSCYYSVTEFRRCATFETIDAATKFIAMVIKWTENRRTCMEYIIQELPEMEFE